MPEPEDGTYFDPHQRATVAAAMARIIPTDDTPGAAEAGTIDFLDRYLSGVDYVYAKPDGSGFEELDERRARAWQQRVEALRGTYRRGIVELDQLATAARGSAFVDLDSADQDAVLHQLAGDGDREAELHYGGPVEPALQQTNAEVDLDVFPLLVMHTRQGFYADPIYGGNRDHVGWSVIGFPGPASLAEVHEGRYTSLPWFAERRDHPGGEA